MKTVNRKMDALIEKGQISVLDHGFIRVVDYMGDDEAVIQAARVSYGQGTEEKRNLQGLINYLMRHWHSTPFEMCEIKVHVKLPVFVARQWIRHRTANVNEYSARYSILDREFYVPEVGELKPQSTTNNQGRDEGQSAPIEMAEMAQQGIYESAGAMYEMYKNLLMVDEDGNEQGIARELARMVLPTNIYTQWYWKVDVHNLMHFLRLRADPHAQWEIRQYAFVLCDILKQWMPATYHAFEEYRLNAVTLSATEASLVHQLVLGKGFDQLDYGSMSKGEKTEFFKKVGAE